ncbi:MAG: hypothetical protein ACTSUE_16790 [Promethearchaeota archaeon]
MDGVDMDTEVVEADAVGMGMGMGMGMDKAIVMMKCQKDTALVKMVIGVRIVRAMTQSRRVMESQKIILLCVTVTEPV